MLEPVLKKKNVVNGIMKKQFTVTIAVVSLLVFVLIGSSYAILNARTETGLADVVVQSGNLIASILTNDGEIIEMNYTTLGVSNEIGLTYDPYTFSVQNNGETTIGYYELRIVDREHKISTLPHKSINFAISKDNGAYTNPQNLGDNHSYIFAGSSLAPGESDDFNLKLWVNEEFGQYANNKVLNASIELTLYSDIPTRNYIIYDTQGGGYVPKSNITSKRITNYVPIKEGYNFAGWSNTPNGDLLYATNALYEENNGTILYAIWIGGLYETLETSLASYLLPVDGEGDYDSRIISGSKTDENLKNYVWYSGKLWRIVSLNNNGTIKLVTQDNITTIAYNPENQPAFASSYMYQWLNEDFLDTLYNYEEIIDMQSKWNATETTETTKPANTTIVESPVGLLNAYEYTKSYSKATIYFLGYLNINYYWWLLTPYSSSDVHYVDGGVGNLNYFNPIFEYGARPSINLKSNIIISGGSGTKTDPYRLVGDIATNSTLLNERVSGEYVNFNGGIYRIVNIESGVTKITAINNVLSTDKAFGASSEVTYGMHVTKNNDGTYQGNSNYVDGYLNTEWYNNLDSNYKNMIVEGTWYLGMYGGMGVSYKQTICDPNITGNLNKTTKACSKNPNIWIGPVGLGRAGEMFTSQLGNGYSDSGRLWTITPYSSSHVCYLTSTGDLSTSYPILATGARPSINLKSDVAITSGLGTLESPFEIDLNK